MKHQIICDPTYSAVQIDLAPGERIVGESGAMAWMSGNMKTQTSTRGGLLAGMKRKLLSGESFFQNTYTPEGGPGSVTFAPGSAGDIIRTSIEQRRIAARKRSLPGFHRRNHLRFQMGRTPRILQRRHVCPPRNRYRNTFLSRLRRCLSNRCQRRIRGRQWLCRGMGADALVQSDARPQDPLVPLRRPIAAPLLRHAAASGCQSRSPRVLASWVYPFRRVESKND